MIKWIIISMLVLVSASTSAQEIWMAGPTFHLEFGNKHIRPSYGFEASYWNVKGFIYSVDAGIEYSCHRFRIYSETQTGIVITGVSFGPVLEKGRGEPIKLGLQGSVWLNYFFGLDYRVRYINGAYYQCPGTYFKLPLNYNEITDEIDKYNKDHPHSHHGDLFDD